VRQQMSFVVLFKICLGQACGLDYERFSALLRVNNAGKDPDATEHEKGDVPVFAQLKSDTHKRDYSLVPLDAAATRAIS